MRKQILFPAFLLVLAAVVFMIQLNGAQAAARVEVSLSEFKIGMSSTTIPAGIPITFVATNEGQTMHEVVLENSGSVDEPLKVNGTETEIQNIAPGETKSAIWTITQPGVYQLACHVPGHFDAGMVEQFTVYAATGGEGAQAGPLEIAAPLGGGQAERATFPLAGVGATVPVWWLVAALAIPIAAAGAAFLLIVRSIGAKE